MRVNRPACVDLLECPSLPSVIAHGFVNGSGSLEGAGYEFSCERGYSLIGVSRVVCTDAGVWNGSLPTCLIGEKKTNDIHLYKDVVNLIPATQRLNKDITYVGRSNSKMLGIPSQPLGI